MSSKSYKNPTPLALGAEGVILGRRAKVVGRSVLNSGDGYQWNEYHLKLDDASETTLVFESGIWKRFALFDPNEALSADMAANLGVGDNVTLKGQTAVVKYVGQSRVVYIEGTAPEGYRVGSEARYFNAESGGDMFVVSWTGSEVEFYEGENLPGRQVEQGFGLPETSFFARIFSGGSGSLDSWFEQGAGLYKAAFFAVIVYFFFFAGSCGPTDPAVDPAPPLPAPAERLRSGAEGDLGGSHYVVVGHRLNQISQMEGIFGRHEYDLLDAQGARSLLVQKLAWNAPQWYLFHPVSAGADMTPNEAGSFRQGSPLRIGDKQGFVRTLYLCHTIDLDGNVDKGVWTGAVTYGFIAQTSDGYILARWTATDIDVMLGQIVSDREVQLAFGHQVKN